MLKYSVGSYLITRLYNFTNTYTTAIAHSSFVGCSRAVFSRNKLICICKFTKRSGLHEVMVKKICWSMERRWRRRQGSTVFTTTCRTFRVFRRVDHVYIYFVRRPQSIDGPPPRSLCRCQTLLQHAASDGTWRRHGYRRRYNPGYNLHMAIYPCFRGRVTRPINYSEDCRSDVWIREKSKMAAINRK